MEGKQPFGKLETSTRRPASYLRSSVFKTWWLHRSGLLGLVSDRVSSTGDLGQKPIQDHDPSHIYQNLVGLQSIRVFIMHLPTYNF